MNQLWHNRPEWLVLTETPHEDLAVSPECVAEMKINSVHGLMTSEDSTGLSQIIRCEDFSSYNHLISVTALVLKFCHLLQCRVNLEVAEIPFEEKLKAEELWILESQKCLTGH